MTVGEWLDQAAERLRVSGCPDPGADAEWMLSQACGFARSSLRLRRREQLSAAEFDDLDSWLARRLTGEPLQYVLGTADFMDIRLKTDARALIPRPETETLAELAIMRLRGMRGARCLDLCCGTGAIGLAAAHALPYVSVCLADVSDAALSLARENAALLGLDRVTFARGDLFDAVAHERFHLIACNPPYLTEEDMLSLQREVRFEPALALDGGRDGLDFYRRLADEAKEHLTDGGVMLMELGMGQDEAVLRLFGGWRSTAVHNDLMGVSRVAEVRL